MIVSKTNITEAKMSEVKMEVVYFVSPNGSVEANEMLQQYVDDQNKRGNLKTVAGEAVDVYQIKRDLIQKIRANKNLKSLVKFYSQYLEQPLKELVFPKKKIALDSLFIKRAGKLQLK